MRKTHPVEGAGTSGGTRLGASKDGSEERGARECAGLAVEREGIRVTRRPEVREDGHSGGPGGSIVVSRSYEAWKKSGSRRMRALTCSACPTGRKGRG